MAEEDERPFFCLKARPLKQDVPSEKIKNELYEVLSPFSQFTIKVVEYAIGRAAYLNFKYTEDAAAVHHEYPAINLFGLEAQLVPIYRKTGKSYGPQAADEIDGSYHESYDHLHSYECDDKGSTGSSRIGDRQPDNFDGMEGTAPHRPVMINSGRRYQPSRTIHLSKLDPAVTVNDLKTIFSRYGVVLDVNLKHGHVNRSSYGFIKFADMDMAQHAKKMMVGRKIGRFEANIADAAPHPTRCLWVGGIGQWTSIERLYSLFSRFSDVIEVKRAPDGRNAFVLFPSFKDAGIAMEALNNTKHGEDHLRLDYVGLKDFDPDRAAEASAVQEESNAEYQPGHSLYQDKLPRSSDRPERLWKTRPRQKSGSRSHERSHSKSRSSYYRDQSPVKGRLSRHSNEHGSNYHPRYSRDRSPVRSSPARRYMQHRDDSRSRYSRDRSPLRSSLVRCSIQHRKDSHSRYTLGGSPARRHLERSKVGRRPSQLQLKRRSAHKSRSPSWSSTDYRPTPHQISSPNVRRRHYNRSRSSSTEDTVVSSARNSKDSLSQLPTSTEPGQTRRTVVIKNPEIMNVSESAFVSGMCPTFESSSLYSPNISDLSGVPAASPSSSGNYQAMPASVQTYQHSLPRGQPVCAVPLHQSFNASDTSSLFFQAPQQPVPVEESITAQRSTNAAVHFPKVWSGALVLKNSAFVVNLHLVSGNVLLVNSLLGGATQGVGDDCPALKIAQRMRLDQPDKLDELERRLKQAGRAACVLIATAATAEVDDVSNVIQQRPLKSLVWYLAQKEVAAVVPLPSGCTIPSSMTGVLHAFPPCPFARSFLSSEAPGLDIVSCPADDQLLVVLFESSEKP